MECSGCEKGISMCYNRPCFGTPKEFEAIIDAGFADKLRIDYWIGAPKESRMKLEDCEGDNPLAVLKKMLYDYQQENPNPHEKNVLMLSGGTKHDEDYRASYSPTGRCNLLTEDDKCSLHDLGLKPEQGREACCKTTDDKHNLYYANLWANEEGLAVIEKFKKSVNIN